MATSATPRIVTSMTNPHVQYSVTRESCTCPSFSFGRRKDPGFVCKHIRAAFPPRPAHRVRYCEHCHVDIARDASCFCSDRCRDLSAAAAIAAVEPAPAITLHCWCVRCGERYEWSEAHPLLCPACRTVPIGASQPVRAGHGWESLAVALAN